MNIFDEYHDFKFKLNNPLAPESTRTMYDTTYFTLEELYQAFKERYERERNEHKMHDIII